MMMAQEGDLAAVLNLKLAFGPDEYKRCCDRLATVAGVVAEIPPHARCRRPDTYNGESINR
jgi:hypothetical protein